MPAGRLVFQAMDWHSIDLPAHTLGAGATRAAAGWSPEEGARGPKSQRPGSRGGPAAEAEDEGEPPEGGDQTWSRHVFVIHAFGRTAGGESVCLRLTKFTPHFYVRPEGSRTMTGSEADDVLEAVWEGMSRGFRGEMRGGSLVRRAEARGFAAGEKFDFVSVRFDSRRAMKHAAYRLRDGGGRRASVGGVWRRLLTYESSLDPLVSALHVMDVQTAGWLEADLSGEFRCPGGWTSCSAGHVLSCRAVSPHAGPMVLRTAPFVVSAYDIEAVGSSDNFPVPSKDYGEIADRLSEVLREAVDVGATRQELRGIVAAFLMMCFGQAPPPGSDAADAMEKYGKTNVLAASNAVLVRTKRPAAPGALHAACWGASEDARDVFLSDRGGEGSGGLSLKGILGSALPPLAGDTVTQVGVTTGTVGSPACDRRWIAVLGTCSALRESPGATVVECGTEAELLAAFRDEIASADPDVLLDYNGSNFDWSFLWGRALELGAATGRRGERERPDQRRQRTSSDCDAFVRGLSRLSCDAADFVERRLSSSALGDNLIRHVDMPGRVGVDIYREVLKTHKLDSYKLDDVAWKVVGDRKLDMDHREMKRLQAGSADDRARVADYCVQDCALCVKLAHKLKIVPGAMAMASLTRVPTSAIFHRGQGVKTGSLVFYTCRRSGKLMRDMPRPEQAGGVGRDEASYKGATVQKAAQGLYDSHPVAVLDFASLYPSVMQSGDVAPGPGGRANAGISYDNLVEDDRYLGRPGYLYHTIEYPLVEGKGDGERVVGTGRCTFARPEDDAEHERDPGVLPLIQKTMLSARAAKRRQMAHRRVELVDGAVLVGTVRRSGGTVAVTTESGDRAAFPEADVASDAPAYTDAELEVMDCQQLSFKLTANSLYGQLGAKTSEIRDKRLAACVTTVGRNLIGWVVRFAEESGAEVATAAFARAGMAATCRGVRVVYGDTDSVFLTLEVEGADGAPILGREAIPYAMAGSEAVAGAFTAMCARPNVLEPEKTYFPLLLRGKKMYCGNLYPHGSSECKFSTMGLSTKRRDNAPVSKRAINALLGPIMASFDVAAGLAGLALVVSELVDGRVPLDDLVISKTLRGSYKFPDQIPHKCLAERMGRRDSGTKPAVNSRVPYVFTEATASAGRKRKVLQGDRIEHPDYVRARGIKPDLLYYLETQVAGYSKQLLGVIVERLPGYQHADGHWDRLEAEMREAIEGTGCAPAQADRRVRNKIESLRQDLAQDLVFGPVLAAMRARRDRQSLITSFFSPNTV